MTTFERILVILTAAIWFFVIVYNGHCDYEIGPPCHPEQHTCTTDASCEEEEAYFLDLDELHQSDNESLNDNTTKQLSPTRILEVK